jgi:hypothetical protein
VSKVAISTFVSYVLMFLVILHTLIFVSVADESSKSATSDGGDSTDSDNERNEGEYLFFNFITYFYFVVQ